MRKKPKSVKKKLLKRLVPKNSYPSPMLVMGLGNPGPRYESSRHNVGYRVVDIIMQEPPSRFRRRLFASYRFALFSSDSNKRPLIIVRYDGYMNRSGEVVPGLMRKFNISAEDLYVIVDNMDLMPGICRLKQSGGDAGHNGLKSIIHHIGSGNFNRLYIGVGRPGPGVSVVDHVLGNPDVSDAQNISKACLRASESIRELRSVSFARVSEELNRREY